MEAGENQPVLSNLFQNNTLVDGLFIRRSQAMAQKKSSAYSSNRGIDSEIAH